ncbi:hypothetical protein D3C77_380290 [compost metagenome]
MGGKAAGQRGAGGQNEIRFLHQSGLAAGDSLMIHPRQRREVIAAVVDHCPFFELANQVDGAWRGDPEQGAIQLGQLPPDLRCQPVAIDLARQPTAGQRQGERRQYPGSAGFGW